MRRILCAALLLALLLGLSVSAAGAEGFVPSISYKPAPELMPDPELQTPQGGKEDIEDCLVVTPVSEANTSELIPAEARDLLLQVYDQLLDGSMELPIEKFGEDAPEDVIIRDLVDVSLLCGEHPPVLSQEGVILRLTFDLKLEPDAEVYIMSYKDGEWVPCEDTVNNGDGTVITSIEDVGPVVFCVPSGYVPPSDTGDRMGGLLLLWVLLMILSAAAMVVLTLRYNRQFRRRSSRR